MSKDKVSPPCKYEVGQVLGKVDVVVNDVTWDDDEWFISIGTHSSYSIDDQTYSESFISDELLPDIDPVKRLAKLKQQAEELSNTIKTLEQEIGV